MDRAGSSGDILRRILSAPSRAVVLRGPAASGKTEAALEFYRHFREQRNGGCLLIAPNAPAVAAIKRKLLAKSPHGVIVSPEVVTFAALGARILTEAGIPAAAMPAFQRHLLLRRIVDELTSAGKLPSLSAVADTPGAIAALDRAISDLKRAAIEPETLANAIRSDKGKHRDLLEVYRRYQVCLHERRAYDLEGRMWQALDYLAGGGNCDLGGAAAICVDAFTDFTPTQLQILALLAGRLERTLITLPCADDARRRMWHWTGRTLNNIRKAFGQELAEIAIEARRDDGGELRPLWEKVFDLDATAIHPPKGLHVIAAGGAEAEIAAVAPRIKRLLVSGAPSGSIAVLARWLDEYREPIERIFARHDIPIAPDPRALADEPIVRFLLDVASLGPEFAFRDVLRVIKSSYFTPRALGDFDEATVAAAEMLIREGNVLEGRAAYAAAAQRLADVGRPTEEADDEQNIQLGPLAFSREHLARAAQMLAKLFEISELAKAQEQSPWISAGGLLRICDALELRRLAREHDDPRLAARDLRALAALVETIGQVDGPLRSLAHLREALGAAASPPPRGESLVDVLDVLDARALRYEHVFLLGLGEGHFPRMLTDGPLLAEADRLAWARRGVRLDSRTDLTAREMLLFYLAISRAETSLTLSYQHSDSAGRVAAPGAFLMSLLETFGGLERAVEAGIVAQIPPGQLVPAEDDLASARDTLNAALMGLFQPRGNRYPSALRWAANRAADKIAAASMGIWAHQRRWRAGPCDSFDGRVTDASLLGELAERFGGRAVFSASQFNMFGQCPWSFFATYVLNLAPLATPQRRLEAVSRGLFCHSVLFRLSRELAKGPGEPVSLPEVPEDDLTSALERAVQAESAAVESRRPAYPVLWQILRDQMHRRLREYLLYARGNDVLRPRSTHFELGFGHCRTDSDSLDPASRTDPVTIQTPAGKVRLSGKIDRVDHVHFEGRRGLMVIDYKTGSLPARSDILAGRNLQLPLYSAAAEEMLGEPCLGGAFHRIGPPGPARERLFAVVAKRGGTYKPSDEYEGDLAAAIDLAGRFVQAMRAGQFDLLPTHACPSYCPFRCICHFSEARRDLKAPREQRT